MADFFEKLKKGIDRGVTTISVRSREMLETGHLRSQIKVMQEERRHALEEVGNMVYTLYGQDRLEEERERVHAKCESLAALDQKIREREEEVRQVQLRAQEVLSNLSGSAVGACDCGTLIYGAAKFCGGCGKSVQEILSRALTDFPGIVTRCPRCGGPVAAESRFCGGCGANLSAEGPATPG